MQKDFLWGRPSQLHCTTILERNGAVNHSARNLCTLLYYRRVIIVVEKGLCNFQDSGTFSRLLSNKVTRRSCASPGRVPAAPHSEVSAE